MRKVVGERREPDAGEPWVHAPSDLPATEPAESERKADVLAHSPPGEQSVSLEEEAHIRPHGAHGIAADGDGAGRGGQQSGDQREDRRLSAAGWADDRDEATLIDVQIDAVDG